ncbi:MAG: uncharacterized protein QOJ73_117 [Streptosporangiaceae bacterium]|nr:uncharacterized protein [Streptosporangiaceae bacterium]
MTPRGPGDPGRDRDPAGRPRNARPRDALGRPLPRDAQPRDAQPRDAQSPDAQAEDRIPDDLLLPPADALALAQRLLDSGRPFHAHEVLEASWKAAPQAERELWRGLAQVAVGLTHAERGNARGAAALLRRGGQAVGGYATAAPYGIDAAGLARECARLAARIEEDGATPVAAQALRLRLTLGPART